MASTIPRTDLKSMKLILLLLLSRFSRVQFCVTLWTVARQTPMSTGFSRQDYWSGLPHPPPGNLSYPGIKPTSLCLLRHQVGFLPLVLPGKPYFSHYFFAWEHQDTVQKMKERQDLGYMPFLVSFLEFWDPGLSPQLANSIQNMGLLESPIGIFSKVFMRERHWETMEVMGSCRNQKLTFACHSPGCVLGHTLVRGASVSLRSW